jgi:hypothetical protein
VKCLGKHILSHVGGEDHGRFGGHSVGRDIANAGDYRTDRHKYAEQQNTFDRVGLYDVLKDIAQQKRDHQFCDGGNHFDRNAYCDPRAQRF